LAAKDINYAGIREILAITEEQSATVEEQEH
jgi:hypothetical protein